MRTVASAAPCDFNQLNKSEPMPTPMIPPIEITRPMRKSTPRRSNWPRTEDMDEAAAKLAPAATATGAGMPISIKSGVIKKPPPTPKMPDKQPTTSPKVAMSHGLTAISAMGR